MNNKQQALLTVARAYLDRGSCIQYDQRSMDRVLQLTPRRRKRLPPEAANSQYIQFLDCSGYVSAIYLEAFGYMLPSDLTWLMIDQMEPRIFYYELTHTETTDEIRAVEKQIRELLQPGDLITFDRGEGAGHIMLYLGNGQYTDCNVPAGQKNSYNYTDYHNQLHEHGLWVQPLELILPVKDDKLTQGRSLFRERNRRISIHRPLDIVGEPLPKTRIRMEQARDLWCAVENSAPGCLQAYPGGTVTYTVVVRNQSNAEKTVTVTFAPPAGTTFAGETSVQTVLQGGEEGRLAFSVCVGADNTAIWLEGPAVTVNQLPVYAHPVLLGRPMSDGAWASVKEVALRQLEAGATGLEAAAKAYAPFEIAIEPVEKQYSISHFAYHDSTMGPALSRAPQMPFADLAVYAAFGGRGVITPEMASSHGMRLTYISRKDLLPGDVLLCLDDGLGAQSYSSFYDGQRLIGRFAADQQTHTLTEDETDRFIDSLFGRFAFVLLRPWQGRCL